MVSNFIGDTADKAGGFVDDAVGDDLAKADKILGGAEREPIDIEAIEAEFIKGRDLATPDGSVPSAAAAPNPVGGSGKPKTGVLNTSKKLEFVHYGFVHRDYIRNFHHDEMSDTAVIDLSKVTGSRAIYFRAALEREAVLMAGFARSTQTALDEKDKKEGGMGDIMEVAQDLLGGPGGTANTAAAADLVPFLDKVEQKAWVPLNDAEITYAKLHDAGIKLHEVRAALRKYVREQIKVAEEASAGDQPAGLLGDLPFIGEIPIPGKIGEVLGFMQGVTGKLHDVQVSLILNLLDKMQGPIEAACMEVTLNAIAKKESPIYPAWFIKPKDDGGGGQPLADMQGQDVIGGDLKKIGALDKINQGVHDAVGAANTGINDATEKPMELIDFLSKPVDPAPGSPFLAGVFEAQAEPGGAYFGSAYLGKVAVGCFGRAMGDGEIPGFMTGFVGTIVENVFSVCAEFLRSVYDKLCCLAPAAVIKSEELVEAGRKNLVFQLVDLILEKTGLDDLIAEHLTYPIPAPPMLPPGINWPSGNLSAAPIIAELKGVLADKLGPYIDPVVEYLMAGLAQRLNASRQWAGRSSMTMEVYLAQLPGELALMFRNLFGPLWEFITDTLMGVINNALQKVLGPVADAVGVAKDGLDKVTGAIADAKKMAQQAQDHAKAIEDQISKFESMSVSGKDDLDQIIKDGEDLKDLVTSDPFADGGGPGSGGGGNASLPFPGNRKPKGTGKKIEKAERVEVEKDHKWEEARDAPVVPPPDDGDGDGDAAGAADGGNS
jgi:hypothetical protein